MNSIAQILCFVLFIAFNIDLYGQKNKKDNLNSLGNMVLVEGGTFIMGTEENILYHEEISTQKVTLDSFYIGKYEVTVAEYMAFANSTNNHYPEWLEEDKSFIQAKNKDDITALLYVEIKDSLKNKKHPIVGVSWLDAINYCNWLSNEHGFQTVYTIEKDTVIADWHASGFRLPTEAEWEYAARSGGKKETWSGTILPSEVHLYSNFSYAPWFNEFQDDGYKKIAPRGSFKPNGLGIYDMSGNVMELCWDYADVNYYKVDSTKIKVNPKGPLKPYAGDFNYVYVFAGDRITRGGNYAGVSYWTSCYNRAGVMPNDRYWHLGFRIAKNSF